MHDILTTFTWPLDQLFTHFGLSGLLVLVILEMCTTWYLARVLNNYGIVDIVWAAGFAPLALCYNLVLWNKTYSGDTTYRFRCNLITLMVALWSIRLGWHLLRRVASHHPIEDVRYAKLRVEWGARTGSKMLFFFLLQGVLQLLLSLPFALVHGNPSKKPEMVWPIIVGFGLWAGALLGESIADRQLAHFRADPANKGKVCQVGLWNYSRHPNYFFEWLVWVGYAVFALGSQWGWLGLIAPALMLHFLLNVTGIPMTEELSLKSKGDAYRAYQRTTSAFVPWFKKKESGARGQESELGGSGSDAGS
ncbi:MAG: DUF1295 domain-containing protein [Proteobacteria bacterium]|nr:DUF1295 domain-containing protein [Pseudomonadota bacterium]